MDGVETIIQEDRGKQADIDGEAEAKLVEDLPWGEACFVGVRASQVEVELIERYLAQELGAAAGGFQVVGLIPRCGIRRWTASTSL